MLQPSTKTYSASVAGLVTDGNDITVAEQSNLDEANYELLRDGTRRRRRAILQEHSLDNQEATDKGIIHSCYLWQTPSHRTDISIVVEQQGSVVQFYQYAHDTPVYVKDNQVYQIDLQYWGIRPYLTGSAVVFDTPCTYAEGNGALYLFNKVSGTVKIEFLDTGLRATPVGTWIRDYEGIEERLAPDDRPSVLTANRGYNLSNTGWDADGVQAFFDQSTQAYTIQDPTKASIGSNHENIINVPAGPASYPAYTDRYLSGRQLDESGFETFSFKQLVNARRNSGTPPMGARVRSSDLHPAGSLVGEPYERTANISQFATGVPTLIGLEIVYETPQYTDPTDSNRAVFIHYMTFTIDGIECGLSGVFVAETVNDGQNNKLRFFLNHNQFGDADTVTIDSLYIHTGSEYFPHRVQDSFSNYDYRTLDHPHIGEFFAGRLWQTGDEHNRVYYSQQVEAGTQSGEDRGVVNETLCYAAADPTDGFDNALVATDGGYINLSDSGTHYGLVTLGASLVLLTNRGIWLISPGQQGFFLADDFRVQKISDYEVLGYRAYVMVGTILQVATDHGLMGITADGQIQNLTDGKWREEYDRIIVEDQREPVAMYDPVTRVARWMFPQKANASSLTPENTVMMSYHELHDAWFRYTVPSLAAITDGLVLPYISDVETYNRFRYLTVTPAGVINRTDFSVEANLGVEGYDTWVEEHSAARRFNDFVINPAAPDVDPESAYMLTNHMIMGDGNKFSHINYLTAYNRNVNTDFEDAGDGSQQQTIPGSTQVQARWDWFDNENKHKYSPLHETYRYRRSYFDYNEDLSEPNLVSKIKVRGRGREFRLYWTTDTQTDSHITGWTLEGLTHTRV